ncbi:MAG TPA: hypothetical protein VF859_01105 [Burkholderiales bacterium]
MDLGHLMLQGLSSLGYILLVVAAAVLPPYLIMKAEWRKLRDGEYLRETGVFIRKLAALDAVAEVIGRYNGADIYRYVVFKGMRYEFDHIVPTHLPREVHERELFLEPGVVYVTH